VKPENVYLVRRAEQDFVKVVDFGVSKAVRSREEADGEWQRLTRTGAVLGTPLFMSPEQAAGADDIDERADIWATALILYECLTGELPFRGNNYLGVIAQIQNKDVQPPSALRPELGIPSTVDRVVMRGLEKDRVRRYQRMELLERDIDRLLAGEVDVAFEEGAGPDVDPARSRRTRWPWHVGVAAIFALGIGTAALLARTGGEAAKPEVRALPVLAPRPSATVPKATEPPRPVELTPTTAPGERVRRPVKGNFWHPAATAPDPVPPPVKKTKADDKIAPSPYTAPRVP